MNNKVFFNRAPLPQNEYAALPLTAIKPEGWLKAQLETQARRTERTSVRDLAGCVGRVRVAGGPGDPWERAPYYLDGLLPLAYLTGDEKLIAQAGR